jgi:hypothetical protein
MAFEEKYPYLATWVKQAGPIQIGYSYNPYDPSLLRVIHFTELIWSSDQLYSSLDDAFVDMEKAIITWCAEQGITLVDGNG